MLLIPGRMLLTVLLQFQVRPAVVSMINISIVLADRVIRYTPKIYVYTIQKSIHGVESTSTQFQIVK